MGKVLRTLDDFEVVVEGLEVYDKHRCFDKNRNGANTSPKGRIMCCKDCGRHWYAKESWADSEMLWKAVRWYHFKMRRAIVGK